MEYFNYKWYGCDLLVACPKCGDKIPFQGIDGHPQCSDCGHTMHLSWTQVMEVVELNDLKKQGKERNTKKIFGQVEANLTTTLVGEIPCLHCKQKVHVPADTPAADVTCNHCSRPLPVKQNNEVKGYVFYRSGNGTNNGQSTLDMVAVRCASCGAPLQANPYKNNYHCQFCNTENILPPSMRRKVMIDDMFVGIQVQRLPAQQALTTNGADLLKRILRENKRTDYTDQQLDEMILRFPNDLSVLNFFRYEYKYAVPQPVYEQLWQKTTQSPMLFEAGKVLKKEQAEIEKWASQRDPNYVKKQAQKIQPVKKQMSKKTEKYLVIAILIALAIYFGWQFWDNYANKK